jgi:hypothetical protein
MATSKSQTITKEALLGFILSVFPIGWDMSGLPPNIVLACFFWVCTLFLVIHILWILDWTARFSTRAKTIGASIMVITICIAAFKPVREQYRIQHGPSPEQAMLIQIEGLKTEIKELRAENADLKIKVGDLNQGLKVANTGVSDIQKWTQSVPFQRETQTQPSIASQELKRTIADLRKIVESRKWGLTPEQLLKLSERMAPFAPQEERPDLVLCVMNDVASMRFGENLGKALRDAGWKIGTRNCAPAMFSIAKEGIVIQASRETFQRPSAAPGLLEFAESMKEFRILPEGEVNDGIPVDQFKIIVGAKPQ